MNEYKISMIVFSIADSMVCDACPYPCKSKTNSSFANCAHHWYDILKNAEYPNAEHMYELSMSSYLFNR